LADVGENGRVDSRNRSLVANRLAVPVDQVVALVVGGVTLKTELVGERVDLVLRRPNPFATDLGHLIADRQWFVEEPAANAIARLANDYRKTLRFKLARSYKASQAGADNDYIGIVLS
jgi:hypothetical protein